MTRLWRLFGWWLAISLLVGAAALPAWASGSAQDTAIGPRTLTGSYATTNPIYPTIGANVGIALYDYAGMLAGDYNYLPPVDAQVIGTIDGDIVSGTYTLALPVEPQGVWVDVDGDASTPPAVQVFVTSTYIEYLGGPVIDRGESPMDMSIRLEPMSYAVTGGQLVVWAAGEGEQFPAGLGPDGALFTGDEPLMALPAGWSVVDLDAEPFTVQREPRVDVPLIESVGALNDYGDLDYEAAWNELFERTRETYPFTADKNIDWQAIYDEITPVVKRATSDLEFHLTIARFGGLIPDTHIGYVSAPVLQTFLLGGVGIDALAVTDNDEVVVVSVRPQTPAAAAGIAPGDVLMAVDGEPALQALDNTPLLMTSASTPHGRRYMQAAVMLQGPIDTPVALSWRTPTGAKNTQTLVRVWDVSSILRAFEGTGPPSRVVAGRMLESGIGYISVRGFAEEVSVAETLFAQELQRLLDAGATGIILDVRYNSGGLVNLSMAMAGHFFPDYTRLFDLYYADGTGGFAFRGYVEIIASLPYYDGPVAVLVNEMTGSAGDMFAYAMQTDGRALIVGHTPSGGFAGEVRDGQYALPGGMDLQIPTGRPVDPVSGATLIEGAGVAPDVRVPVTIEGLLSPADEVLQAAEAALLAR